MGHPTTYYFSLLLFLPIFCFGQYELVLEKLPIPINTPHFDEIAPILSHDGQTLYFTRVGYPDFDKTLEVNGQDLSLSLSPNQYNSYLANIYTRIAGQSIRNAVLSSYNQDVWIATFEKK